MINNFHLKIDCVFFKLLSSILKVFGPVTIPNAGTWFSESGVKQSRAVLDSSLPLLLHTWQQAPQDARPQLISSVDQLIAAAANSGKTNAYS